MNDPPTPEVRQRERLLDTRQWDHAEDVEDGDVDRRRPDQVLQPNPAAPELTCGFDERIPSSATVHGT